MGGLVAFAGLLLFIVGIAAAVKGGLPALKLASRKAGLLAIAAGVLAMGIGIAIPTAKKVPTPKVSESPSPSTSPSPTMSATPFPSPTVSLAPTQAPSPPPPSVQPPPPPTASPLACGVERWAVKTGEDRDAGTVDLAHPKATTLAELVAIPAPYPEPSARLAPVETTNYQLSATMTGFKREADRDYHVILSDGQHTMIAEIPDPPCTAGPFTAGINSTRAEFDRYFQPSGSFRSVSVPVVVTGVGFFDRVHGQSGVAPNGIELHPLLSIVFGPGVPLVAAPPPVPGPPVSNIQPPAPGACDPSYPDFCIPPPPPDLNCRDIPQKRFTVRPPDPHGFDGNNDGVGCER